LLKLSHIFELALTLKTDTTDNKRTEKGKAKYQRFAKLKEVFCQRNFRHKNTTFNFAQPHPSPPTTLTNQQKRHNILRYLYKIDYFCNFNKDKTNEQD
jgi:hypothetical protein